MAWLPGRALHFWAHIAAAQAYSEALGLALAYTEKTVYCGRDRFDQWDVGDSLIFGPRVEPTKVRFVDNFATQAAAGVGRMTDPEGCFVALRGTFGGISGLMDAMFWLKDFGRKSCPGCEVDFGFSESYESIKGAIFDTLQEFGCKNQPLYLVGHSMGAAGVTYLLFDALDKGYVVKAAYALESPRPGNAAFAETLHNKSRGVDAWRVAHFKDIVVHVPPSPIFYTHALPEIYYTTRDGVEYKVCGIDSLECSGQWLLPWQLTAKDHMWYLNLNPCSCQNDTKMTFERLAKLHRVVNGECEAAFARRAGDASCGQRIEYLRTVDGFTRLAAMSKVANEYPEQCGVCALPIGSASPSFSGPLFNAFAILALLGLAAFLYQWRSWRSKSVAREYTEVMR